MREIGQSPDYQLNVERQNVEWDKMPNAKMSNETKCRMDKISNDTKRRTDKISNVKNVERDKTSNGTNCRIEITLNETKFECQNVEWDKTSNVKMSNGTECRRIV